MPEPAAPRAPRRPLWTVVAALLLAAGALWLSSSLHWYPSGGAVGDGRAVTGAALVPQLTPIAVLALAAVAAVLATSGLLRRVLGALLVVVAGWVAWLVVQPARPAGAPAVAGAPGLAVTPQLVLGKGLVGLAAVLLLAAGLVLVLGGHRMPKLGARYQAPGGEPARATDPDRDLWDRLDRGEDPTAAPPEGGGPGRAEPGGDGAQPR